jgi:FKBP-type peptidyl-prolyl cis-trans isomerase FkpA
MTRMRVAVLVLVALAVRVRASPGQGGYEREREEHEREQQEERNRPKETQKGPSTSDDKEALYAMGAILGAKVKEYRLSAKELQIVERGFADAAASRKLQLRDPDLEEWGPKVDAYVGRRKNPKVAAEKDRGRKVAAEMAKEPGAQTLPSGAVVVTERKGDGPQPSARDRVRVKYEGRLLDGKTFDKSDGAEFPLNGIIQCWAEGVQRINVGGKARLVCPPSTAYGDQGRPPQIPPGATLVFTVELLGIAGK